MFIVKSTISAKKITKVKAGYTKLLKFAYFWADFVSSIVSRLLAGYFICIIIQSGAMDY